MDNIDLESWTIIIGARILRMLQRRIVDRSEAAPR